MTPVHPTTHLHCLSQSIQVLRELLEIPKEEWDEFTFLRALAHLHAVQQSAIGIRDYRRTKDFVLNAVASASIGTKESYED